MDANDPRHGTEAGHEQHQRDNEFPCEPCREAKLIAARRRTKRKTMGYTYTVPSTAARERLIGWREAGATYGEIADHVGLTDSRVWELINENPPPVIYTRTHNAIMRAGAWPVTAEGITRRLRALSRLGWTIPSIAEACNVHGDTIIDIRARVPEFVSRKVREGIVAGYQALEMRLPPRDDRYQRYAATRARNHAERVGWLSPMAYDDIDDLTDCGTGVRINPTRDLLAEWHDLRDAGESIEQAAVRLGVTVGAIERAEYRRRAAA